MTAYMIDAEKAWIAMQFVSTEKTRYYLVGFSIEAHKDGALLVSTDGHRGVVVYDSDAVVPETAIIGLGRETVKALKKGDTLKIIDGQAEVIAGETTIHIQPGDCRIDGTFPDWRRAFGSVHEPSGKQAAFNAKYLGSFSALHGPRAKVTAIAVEMNGEAPARITSGHDDRYGVLMPVRHPIKVGSWTEGLICQDFNLTKSLAERGES